MRGRCTHRCDCGEVGNTEVSRLTAKFRIAGYTYTLDIFMFPPLLVVELPCWPRPLRGVEEGCALQRGFAKRFLQM